LTLLGPDPDPGARIGTVQIPNPNPNLISSLSKRLLYLRRYVFMAYYLLLVTAKSDQDPYPDWHGTAIICLPGSRSGSGSALR
jgi:hypothetical protein